MEERCSRYRITARSKEFPLLHEEVRLILNVGRRRFKSLIANDFLKLCKKHHGFDDFKSSSIEKLLIKKNKFIDHEMFTPPKAKPKDKPIQPTVTEISKKLDINFETARKLSKTHWLLEDNQSIVKVISYEKLKAFHENYVTASTLARKLKVNPTNLVEKLLSIGIVPVSGPHIDGLSINFYEQSSVKDIELINLNQISHYQTRTGRHRVILP